MRRSPSILALIGALAALSSAALAGQVVVPLSAVSYEIAPAASQFDPGAEFVRIVAAGFGSTGSPGDPDLPCRQIHVALPRDADLASVRVSVADGQYDETQLDHDVVPCGPIRANDDIGADVWGSGKEIAAGRNTLVYGSDAPYPASHVELAHVGQMRLWKLATVLYCPFTYSPSTRVLTLLSSGELVVEYDAESGLKAEAAVTDAGAERFEPALQSMVSNYEEAVQWYQPGAEPKGPITSGAAEFVIMTNSYIVSNSTKFAQFVTRTQERGHTVQVVTESQWGGGTGLAATNNIRQWLKNNYLSLGITYVLLIGNPTPECYIASGVCPACCQGAPAPGDLPMLEVWPHWNEYADPSVHGGPAPTDMYFSDLTGNWDLDGDGVYGDYKKGAVLNDFGPGGVDFYPELYVGRIPFYGDPGNPTQFAAAIADLDKILNKYIFYSPPWSGDWSKRALLPANPLDANHPEVSISEAIKKDILTPAGLNCTRLYDVNGGTEPEVTPCSYDTVREAWQQGYGFVFWTAHGNSTTADDILNSGGCTSLDDTHPSFVFQNSCSTGRPEASDNLGYSLLKNGAIATVAAARISWYGTLDYLNGDRDESMLYRYALRLARWGQTCGQSLAFTRAYVLPTDEYGWDNYAMYNLYGEPSLAGIVTIDECSGAEAITSLPYNTVVSDVGLATTAASDPDLTCGGGGNLKGSHSVWFKLVAPETATYTANTVGSDYDTVLAVFSGGCGALQQVACSDDYVGSRSLVTWAGGQGVTYYIEVTSYGNYSANTLKLEVRRWNDECASAEVIPGVPYKAIEYTGAAVTSAGDPLLSCGSPTNKAGSHTVWYKLTAPYSAPFQANTTGSDYDTVLAVFTGSCGAFNEVTCNDDYGSSQSTVFWQAQQGVTYYIEVTSYGATTGGTLHLEVRCTPPINDESADAWNIYAMPYNAQQDTRCATMNVYDPWLTCSGRGSHSVWYKLTPFDMVPHEANTFTSDYNTALAVFSSVSGQLTEVACNDNYGGTQQSRVSWEPQYGVDFYLIEITSYGGTDGGFLNLAIRSAVPDNDECQGAVVVGALPYTAYQDATYATQGEFDPSLTCGDGGNPKGGHSVWYKFTPGESGDYEANTIGSDYDTVLAVHTGYCNAYSEVACNDDAEGTQSKLTWEAQAGTTYYIEITSYGTKSGGNLQLYVDHVVPANDNCADARVLVSPSDTVWQSTQWATWERNEPMASCHTSYNTVWFKFTPEATGYAVLSTVSSSFDTVLAVYTGQCGRTYTEVACNDDAIGAAPGSRWSAVGVNVAAGVTYLVQVGSYTLDDTGDLYLRFEIGPACRSIGQIKCWPIGSRVSLCNAVITGYFGGFPDVQQPDRSSGIHLTMADPALAVGTRAIAIGDLSRSADGNLYLASGSYVGIAAGTAAKPIGMITADVGGSGLCSQQGAPGGSGPSNISLLVKVWGRVTGVDAAHHWYWIDDGCGLTGDPPYTGLRVWTERTTLPSVNDFVEVVGWPWIWEPYGAPIIREPEPPIAAVQSVDKSVLIVPARPDSGAKDPAVSR